jgi:hypothetical protein
VSVDLGGFTSNVNSNSPLFPPVAATVVRYNARVERFSKELRTHIPNPDTCDEIEKHLDSLLRLRRARIEIPRLLPEFDEKGGMPFDPVKVLVLFQLAIRRAAEVSDSMIRDANAFTYTPVWTSSRSLFELSALVMDIKERIASLLETWDDRTYQDFSEHIDEILLGFKSATWHPKSPAGEPEIVVHAKNILTMIQRIDKKKAHGFMAMYELLSEVAHPNYMGMMEQYQFNTDEMTNFEFVDTPLKRDRKAIVAPLDAARLTLALLASNIEQYDQWFPDFARACDANLKPEAKD